MAEQESVAVGLVVLLGALERGQLSEGSETLELPPVPIATAFFDGRGVPGIRTVVREDGVPVLPPPRRDGARRMTAVGCVRAGARVFAVAEDVVLEPAVPAIRSRDAATGLTPIAFRA